MVYLGTMKLNVVSSNIRFDTPEDGVHCWQGRREILAGKVAQFAPHLLSTQEGRRPQLKDLENLVPLKIVDAHRSWMEVRMYPSLFICPEFSVLASGDIWLSQTPEVPGSKSFGSSFPRLATWAQLKFGGRILFVANLHLDHERSETRLQQIKVFTAEIKKIYGGDMPFLLSGDFNEGPDGAVYYWVTEELGLQDPWRILGYPEQSSFHRFKGDIQDGSRIDWILTSRHFQVDQAFFDTKSSDGIFASDHFPLFLSLTLAI